ncbi:hypothetical protein FGG08_007200, partial [Glutinoglossum americanum]
DIAALALLSLLPQAYLLTMFYRVHLATALALAAVDLLALTLPTALLRRKRISLAAQPLANLPVPVVLLASSIYALAAHASFLTWAPAHLAAHFVGLRDISFAHDAQFPHLVAWFLPLGVAAGAFVYLPAAAAAAPGAGDAAAGMYSPAMEKWWERLVRKYWTRLAPRTKVIVKRTAAVVVVGGGKSWLHTWAMLEGVDAFGAAGYIGIFELGALVTGIVYWWVGNA